MQRLLLPFFFLLVQTACFYRDGDLTTMALDCQIDRPRVLAISTFPQVFQHGTPVLYDALIVAPDGAAPDRISVDVCGLLPDQLSNVYGTDCFKEEDYVTHLADEVPFWWEPPDQSAIECTEPSDTDWDVWGCTSIVPLLIRADFGDTPAFGSFSMAVYAIPGLAEMVELPTVSLTAEGSPVAGGDILLRSESDVLPDSSGWRWYVDAGELSGTGRTADNTTDPAFISENTLHIPEDWHGPLRVFVVVQAPSSNGVPQGWANLTLEVP